MAVIQGPQSGGGWNPLGILATLATVIPGAQVAAPWLQLVNAGVNAAKGNWAGAALSGVGALTGGANGKSIFGSSATKAMPPIEPTMGMDDVRKSLSDLNPMAQPIDIPAPDITPNLDTDFSAKGIVGNMPSNQKAMYGVKDQDYYDNKWNSLTDMYGVKGNTGFNPEAGKKHYRNFGAGGMFDTEENSGIFDALMRLYGKQY